MRIGHQPSQNFSLLDTVFVFPESAFRDLSAGNTAELQLKAFLVFFGGSLSWLTLMPENNSRTKNGIQKVNVNSTQSFCFSLFEWTPAWLKCRSSKVLSCWKRSKFKGHQWECRTYKQRCFTLRLFWQRLTADSLSVEFASETKVYFTLQLHFNMGWSTVPRFSRYCKDACSSLKHQEDKTQIMEGYKTWDKWSSLVRQCHYFTLSREVWGWSSPTPVPRGDNLQHEQESNTKCISWENWIWQSKDNCKHCPRGINIVQSGHSISFLLSFPMTTS